MLGVVWHDEVNIGQLASLRDRPVESNGSGVHVDGGGIKLDVSDTNPEVCSGLEASALIKSLDNWSGTKACIGLQCWHVKWVTNEHGLDEQLDTLGDLVGSCRNIDHCWRGSLLIVAATAPGICR